MIEIKSNRSRQNCDLKQISFNCDNNPIFEIDFSPESRVINYISKDIVYQRNEVFDINSSYFRKISSNANIIYQEKGSVYWNLIGSRYGQDLHIVAEELFHGYGDKSLRMR